MKIKTTKKLNLPELIQHVWENDIRSESFESKFGVEVIFGENRAVIMNHFVGKDDTFTVEVEEELTEETEFEELHEYYWDEEDGLGITEIHSKQTILGILEEHEEETIPLSIMIRDKRDNRPVLIWSRESGIPESGVLEADDE